MLSAVPQATALRTTWREATGTPRRWAQRTETVVLSRAERVWLGHGGREQSVSSMDV